MAESNKQAGLRFLRVLGGGLLAAAVTISLGFTPLPGTVLYMAWPVITAGLVSADKWFRTEGFYGTSD